MGGTVVHVGKRREGVVVRVRPGEGAEVREQIVPRGKPVVVRPGDRVEAGTPLTEGAIDPHELLRVAGPEVVQEHLLAELQGVYRGHGVRIDDRHLEVLLARMLGKVCVETAGDTGLLPGDVIDREIFRTANLRLAVRVKIVEGGDTPYSAGQLVTTPRYERERSALTAAGRRPPATVPPVPATCRALLLGVMRAAMLTDSFLSAASFQQTRRVLAEAAWAGRLDTLTGLKENVMLGRVIPAGTGHPAYRAAEVEVSGEAANRPKQETAKSGGPD
jgi:DNA-directed RNA polymerase subunit beta'